MSRDYAHTISTPRTDTAGQSRFSSILKPLLHSHQWRWQVSYAGDFSDCADAVPRIKTRIGGWALIWLACGVHRETDRDRGFDGVATLGMDWLANVAAIARQEGSG